MASSANRLIPLLRRLLRQDRGNTAITFAFALLPMLAAIGLAVDGGRVYLVKSQLSSAVDVTALTAARLYTDVNRDAKAKEFFAANFSADRGDVKLNPIVIDASIQGATKTVVVTASADMPTYFMRIFGMTTVTVNERAKAARTDYPIELVMALDNTGSMVKNAGGGISRLAALKTAANTLIDSIFGGKEENPNVRVGIVPYTSYVNVGHLLEPGYVSSIPGYTDRAASDPLGWKGCVDADQSNPDAGDDLGSSAWDTAYDTKEMRAGFPVKPSLFPSFGILYDEAYPAGVDTGETCAGFVSETKTFCEPATNTITRCIEGECSSATVPNPDSGKCTTDTSSCTARAPGTNSYPAGSWAQNVPTHPYNSSGADSVFGRPNPAPLDLANPANITNYRYRTPDPAWKAPLAYPSRITDRSSYPGASDRSSDNFDNENENIWDDSNNDGSAASPNTYCPQQALPLAAHKKADIKTYIGSELRAFFPDWGTFSNLGLLWGWRMVSPELPLAGQGGRSGFNKAVVLMTDGRLYHPGGLDDGIQKHDGIRTAYGFGSEKKLVNNTNATKAQLINALQNRLKKTCDNMRKDGVTVYTVTFDPTMTNADKIIYRNCATSASLYYDAPDATTLNAAFAAIADDLAGVRLVE
jgi:Flp pilus assembly protein TadG